MFPSPPPSFHSGHLLEHVSLFLATGGHQELTLLIDRPGHRTAQLTRGVQSLCAFILGTERKWDTWKKHQYSIILLLLKFVREKEICNKKY